MKEKNPHSFLGVANPAVDFETPKDDFTEENASCEVLAPQQMWFQPDGYRLQGECRHGPVRGHSIKGCLATVTQNEE